MAENRISSKEFSLDTDGFDEAAKLCKDLADKMDNLKNEMDGMKSNLLFTWAGEGRSMFEKKYRILSQQFGDLGDALRDISEGIYESEEAYIQRDVDLAKTLEGTDNRY